MKPLLIVADFHINEKPAYRFDIVREILLEDIPKLIKEYDIDKLVCLGDVFEKKDRIPNKERRLIEEFVVLNSDVFMYFLVGNHDISAGNYTTISFLNAFDNVRVIAKPELIRIYDMNFAFIPWNYDPEIFKGKTNVCFAHHEVKELVNFNPDTNYSIDEFPYRVTMSGHIHKRVHYNKGNKDFYYVGAISQRDFRDCGCPESAILFNCDTLQVEFIDLPRKLRFEKVYIKDIDYGLNFEGEENTKYWFVFDSEKVYDMVKHQLEERFENCILELLKSDISFDEVKVENKSKVELLREFLEAENRYPLDLYLKIGMQLLEGE